LALTVSTNTCDERLGLEPGTSLAIVRHLLANRHWQINMQNPINFREPLILLREPTVLEEENGPLYKHAA
jgi:hypothetical protein